MNVANMRLCLQLHSLVGADDPVLTRWLLHCGSPDAAAGCGSAVLAGLGISARIARELERCMAGGGGPTARAIEEQLETLSGLGADILPITDVRYPPLLRTIHDPPPLLYTRGDPALLAQAQLAVVGSRRASAAGLRAAGILAGEATRAGLVIASGLALGVDGAAHRGALAAGGSSIAVMATGIDLVYPARHRGIAQDLVQAGCLVSEFPPGVPPLPRNFPRRNRVISGLSLGVLVVEAALPSGSLTTARAALEQGREVFALPWSPYHTGGAGCLHLIRDGAKMVVTIQDVLEELGAIYRLQQDLHPADMAQRVGLEALSVSQRAILELIGFDPVGVDELCQLSALPVGQLTAELSCLELRGLIQRGAGGYVQV